VLTLLSAGSKKTRGADRRRRLRRLEVEEEVRARLWFTAAGLGEGRVEATPRQALYR
jgi:hypothetical protein